MECELAILDAVSVATDEYAQERLRRIDDILDVVMSLNEVGVIAVLVGHHDGYNSTTVVGYGNLIALTVFQHEESLSVFPFTVV